MMARVRIGNPSIDATMPIDVTFGGFKIGPFCVPYLSSVMSISQCSEYLHLASEDAAFTLRAGKIEELFQRDIDHERVLEMARSYLNPDVIRRPAFFNSITVALLPVGSGAYTSPPRSAADEHDFPHSHAFGPIRVSWTESTSENLPVPASHGAVYWNKRQVRAVAIDGQHRLAALKRLASRTGNGGMDIAVPVILLILDPAFGVRANGDSHIELMRSLFIDLNKNAQKVSRARQLLLDDIDPLAVSLRKLIGPELDFVAASAAPRGAFPPSACGEFVDRLPLELVDWHGEQRAKVDRGPYVTSVLALEWALLCLSDSERFRRPILDSRALARESIEQESDQGYYKSLKKRFEPWRTDVPELLTEIDEAEDGDLVFSPSAECLRSMGEKLHGIWGKALTELLTRSGPYRRLVQHRLDTGTLSADFGSWYQAKEALDAASPAVQDILDKKLRELERELEEREVRVRSFGGVVQHIEGSVKKVRVSESSSPSDHLLFFLTGQRAMVLALRDFVDHTKEQNASVGLASMLDEQVPITPGDHALVCAKLIGRAISHWDGVERGSVFTKECRVDTKTKFPSNLWQGSALRRDDSAAIDFSKVAAERTARQLEVMIAIWLWRKTNPHATFGPIGAWCGSRVSSGLAFATGPAGLLVRRSLERYVGFSFFGSISADANRYPLAFLSKIPLPDGNEPVLDDLSKLAKSRLQWIWERAV